MPASRKRSPAARASRGAEQKNFLFLFKRIFWWRVQIRIVKKVFLRGRPPLCGGWRRGGANWIYSGIFGKIVSNVVVKPHQIKNRWQSHLFLIWCAGQDSNLRRPKPTDLQSAVIDHSTTDALPLNFIIFLISFNCLC